MNIYEKVQTVKASLLSKNLKKSGNNKFAGYNYYELADFLPAIIQLCSEHKLFTCVSFSDDTAKLLIINSEKPEEEISITSPMRQLELKGCNQIQALGGVETYSRRYLYMAAFDIVENDMFDGAQSPNEGPNTKKDKSASSRDDGYTYPQYADEPLIDRVLTGLDFVVGSEVSDQKKLLLEIIGKDDVRKLTTAEATDAVTKLLVIAKSGSAPEAEHDADNSSAG